MHAFDRLIDAVIYALAITAGAIFSAITIALTVNVVLRAFVNDSLYGMVDAIEMGLMAATFLAAPWVLKMNAHVSVDIVLTSLSADARRKVDRSASLLGALLSLIFAWSSISALLIAWERGSMMRGVLVIPEWLVLTAPALGGILLSVEFLRRTRREPSSERQQTGL